MAKKRIMSPTNSMKNEMQKVTKKDRIEILGKKDACKYSTKIKYKAFKGNKSCSFCGMKAKHSAILSKKTLVPKKTMYVCDLHKLHKKFQCTDPLLPFSIAFCNLSQYDSNFLCRSGVDRRIDYMSIIRENKCPHLKRYAVKDLNEKKRCVICGKPAIFLLTFGDSRSLPVCKAHNIPYYCDSSIGERGIAPCLTIKNFAQCKNYLWDF